MSGPAEQSVASALPIETLNQFAASIIHRVSNPLSVIIGNAQYLLLQLEEDSEEQPPENEELIGTVRTILNESMRLGSLMSQLLGLSLRLSSQGVPSPDALSEIERFLHKMAPGASGS